VGLDGGVWLKPAVETKIGFPIEGCKAVAAADGGVGDLAEEPAVRAEIFGRALFMARETERRKEKIEDVT